MSKQKEIREGIQRLINLRASDKVKRTIANAITLWLHSQGVVIKVDRELPKKVYHDRFMTGAGQWAKEGKETGYRDAQQDMLKWHNDSLEPLIGAQDAR